MDWVRDYQLFLFDFDGLLVDTERMHYASYMQMCQERGCPLAWDFQRFCVEAHGKAMGFFDGLLSEYPDVFKEGPSKERLYEEKKRIYSEMLQTQPLELMEGVEALLHVLDSCKVKSAVVTNSPRAQIELIKSRLPLLQTIPVWITREDYSEPKPSPEGYLKAISLLAQEGDRIVGFEDTLKGLKALVAAGVQAMLICPEDHEHVSAGKMLGAQHFATLSSIGTSPR